MNSSVWKGVAAGLALFLVFSGVALFTPARTPALKVFGRDYAAVRLEAQQVRQGRQAAPVAPARVSAESRDRTSPAARLAAWEARAKRFSVFGLMGWLADLWPWLAGFGVALPVLGGLIGAQAGARRASPSPMSSAAAPPARESGSEEVTAPVPEAAALPESLPATPIPPPAPPETWNWNARPVSRATPARPKPPPVESPNADPL